MVLVVKTQGPVGALTGPVLAAVRDVDPEQPVYDEQPMEAVMARTTARGRTGTMLVLVFALAALLLAGMGLYGVVPYSVSGRTREFGARLALGARRDSIAWLVVKQSARLAARGLALGLLISIPIAKLMSLLLFRCTAV